VAIHSGRLRHKEQRTVRGRRPKGSGTIAGPHLRPSRWRSTTPSWAHTSIGSGPTTPPRPVWIPIPLTTPHHPHMHALQHSPVPSQRPIRTQQPHPLLPCRWPEEEGRRAPTGLYTGKSRVHMSRIRSTGRGTPGAGLRSSHAGPARDDPSKLLASDAQTYRTARLRTLGDNCLRNPTQTLHLTQFW